VSGEASGLVVRAEADVQNNGDHPKQQPLSPGAFSAAVSAITNAFGDPTRRQVYLFIHENHGGVTAAQVADRFGLHPNVARHHLDKLASAGHVEVTAGRAGGGAGRPSKQYRAAAEQVTLDVPVKTDDLVLSLLGRALALLPHDAAEKMAEEVGAEYGKAHSATHFTPWPMHSPLTVSQPTPKSVATSCRS
jgi:DNA-binding transcriptional ArsR family regulator